MTIGLFLKNNSKWDKIHLNRVNLNSQDKDTQKGSYII